MICLYGSPLSGNAHKVRMALAFLDRTGGSALAPNPPLGNVLAATTGLTWALTVVALRSRSRAPSLAGPLSCSLMSRPATSTPCPVKR